MVKSDSTIWLKGLAKTAGKWHKLTKIAAFVIAFLTIAQAAILSWLIHSLIMEDAHISDLTFKIIILVLIIVLRYVSAWAREAFAFKASLQVQQNLRGELIDKIYKLGPAWRAKHQGGALVSQLHEQVTSLDGYLSKYIPQMGLVMSVPTLIILAVLPFSWVAALIFFATAPLIPIFMILVGMRAKEKQAEQHKQLARMSGHFLDQLRGLPILQIFNRHKDQVKVVEQVSENFRIKTMEVLRLAFLSSTVLEFFTSVSIALSAVYLGFYFLGHFDFGLYGNGLSLHLAFFILLLAPEFYQPLRDLGTHYHAKAEAEAAAEQLYPWVVEQSPQVAGGTQAPSPFAVSLELKEVDFSYTDDIKVLQGVNLKLDAGKTCVLLGASGSGKTSILRLLLGQLRCDSGDILLEDKNLQEIDILKWREKIGWMSQDTHLFSATLAENLRINAPNATDEELKQALEFVELQTWFAGLDQGLQTKLGEEGRRLSGGQLRRLALARVYLTKASVLLFDEPTASLDEDLELKILEKMRILCKDKTVLLLTHRQAPLTLADKVAVFDAGKIISGSLDEVKAKSPVLNKLLSEEI